MSSAVHNGIALDSSFMNLREIPIGDARKEINIFMVKDERIIQAFQTVRDQVVFTNKRVIVINVQGLTGKKVSYFSYPYAKVQYFGIETAGVLDIDSELVLVFSDGSRIRFDFTANVQIASICAHISEYTV